jgi:hypothetical protein
VVNILKKKALYDILLYIVLPLAIWNYGREQIGDYYALILTSAPGLIYTLFCFFQDKQFNISGLFILICLLITRASDLIAGSATQLLWNSVYLEIGYSIFWIITIIIKKPMGMYFFIDYAYLQGHPREKTCKLYKTKGLFKYFQLFSGLFVVKGFLDAALKTCLINIYGVEGYNQMVIITNVVGVIFAIITISFVAYIVKKIKQQTTSGAETVSF